MPPPGIKNGLGALKLDFHRLTPVPAITSENSHQILDSKLQELTRWNLDQSRRYSIDTGKYGYLLQQPAPQAPIEVDIFHWKEPSSSVKKSNGNLSSLTYFPNGQMQSSSHPEAHPNILPEEFFHHRIIDAFLNQRLNNIHKGAQLHTLLKTSLRSLQGRPVPETQSVWYDNFAVKDGKVYSFQLRNGFFSSGQNPELDQIAIFEDTFSKSGAQRTLLATLSATGEIDFQPNHTERKNLSNSLLGKIEALVAPLQRAQANPNEYQGRLQRKLTRLGSSTKLSIPKIQAAAEIPNGFGSGAGKQGEPIYEIRSRWELLRKFHPWAKHEWKNPEQAAEARQISLRPRLSYHLGRELLQRVGQNSKYMFFGYVRNPKSTANYFRIHLFPNGGGEITTYRNGEIHDHIVAGATGPVWRVRSDPMVRKLNWEDLGSQDRLKALQEAYARRNTDTSQPNGAPYQEAPSIHLDHFHQHPDGSPIEIRDTRSAWNLIQKQIPPGVEPLVSSEVNLHNEMTFVEAHFHNTQPSLSLRIAHSQIPVADALVPRVEIIMQRGHDTHVRVFEDGRLRMEASQDVLHQVLTQAQEGRVQRHLATMVGQTYLRRGTYSFVNGMQFSLAHFLSLPIILGYERLIYTPNQLKTIGTPLPEFNLPYLSRHVVTPFAAMAGSSGLTSVMIDGVYNLRPGLGRAWTKWATSAATPLEALRSSNLTFFNAYPTTRPMAPNFLFRGILQRSLPLLAALTSIELLQHRQITPQFWSNVRNVGLVSLGSAGMLRGVYSFSRLASLGIRLGLIAASGLGTGAALYSLTFGGGVAVAVLEFMVLGMISAHERRNYALIEHDS